MICISKKSYDLKSANSNWIKVIWKYIDITTESFNWQFDLSSAFDLQTTFK